MELIEENLYRSFQNNKMKTKRVNNRRQEIIKIKEVIENRITILKDSQWMEGCMIRVQVHQHILSHHQN